ncbi:MAG TPA: GntR family transcriptional regulator [Solirubrobacterales bacterium]|nr:GntR family transcriptional regulator [Solirubrobacterales bacterium]
MEPEKPASGGGGRRKTSGRRKRPSVIGLEGLRRPERGGQVPLYYQLGEILKQGLEGGGWEPGTLFPSERELEEHFGVSRAVVRPALSLLERDGDIYRRRGSGTYVAAPKRRVPIRGLIRSLLEDRFSDSRIAVLRIRQQTNDQTIADFLDISDGQTVAQVTSILRIDKPICLLDSFFPVERVPWLLDAAISLKGGELPILGESPKLARIDVSFEGSSCGPWTAKILGVRTGDPALVGRLLQYGVPADQSRECPVELTRIVARSDISQFHYEAAAPLDRRHGGSR